ncbi:MAG: ComEC/Rec2 family competence protein [Candidatus Saccharimonadales bacterium]
MKYKRQRYRQTTVQLVLLVFVLAGLGAAHRGYRPSGWIVLGCITAVILAYGRRSHAYLVAMALSGLSLGWWRGAVYLDMLAAYQPYYDQPITLWVTAQEDAVYGKHSQVTFTAGNVELASGQKLVGKLSVSGFGANAIYQGDVIQASGKLRSGYGAKQGSFSFAKLSVVERHNSWVAEIRRRFAAGMQTALPEPLGSFAMGLLIGQRATLPEGVKEDLLMVGLTHIIAVSGYNLTIILHASKKLLAKRSKRLATALSFSLIAIFLLLAGASASIVRAAIVSTLSIVTSYYGRLLPPLNLIGLAAAATAFANPVYIWSDISWYLSFLAFFGVMLLAPLVSERLPGKSESILLAVAIESICAELLSLPIVLFIFGQMSFVGLPANVLVVALIPLAMLLATVSGLIGMLAPVVSGWFGWPTTQLLNYMLDVSHLLASLPNIFREHIGLSLAQMIGWYSGLGLLMTALWYKSRARGATITDETW